MSTIGGRLFVLLVPEVIRGLKVKDEADHRHHHNIGFDPPALSASLAGRVYLTLWICRALLHLPWEPDDRSVQRVS
ncbi:unnamed protein product [Lathyrus oleraceus]